MRLFRTEYWNPSTGTVRGGSTAHGESLVDVESYLEPLRGALLAALMSPGVADGLTIGAVTGQPGLSVSTGTGVDGQGRVAVLSDGGAAIVDQTVPADQVQNVPVVLVGATGVDLPTTGLTGDVVLTLTWREVLDSTSLGNTPTLLHAPWLRLEDAATFADDGTRVVLATASLDAAGAVTALGAGTRGPVALPAGGLTFRNSGVAAGASPEVAESAGAQLRPRADGGLDIVLAGTSTGALSLQGDGTLSLGGNVRIGTPGTAARPLHVEGNEVHSGGPGGGFSFADRTGPGFVEVPAAGERWVWYAEGGFVRLWSGSDQLIVGAPGQGGGLDVPRRIRLRQGPDPSAGIWLHQNGPGDAAFVGMADDTHVGVSGTGPGFALTVDVTTGALQANGPTTVSATLRANQIALPAAAQIVGDGRLHITGGELLYLLNHDGVIVGKEWGGNGNLTVEGTLTTPSQMRANGGIGLSAGAQIVGDGRLHITGGELLYLLNHDGVIVGKEWGGNGNLVVEGNLRVDTNNVIPSWSGGGITTFDLFAAGGVYVGEDPANPKVAFYSNGTKHFVIDHPLDPENRDLHHVCIEGPEVAVFYRGSGRLEAGRAEVELPGYFEALTRAEDRTVMLTPVAEDGEPVTQIAASPVREGRFTVRAADGSNPRQRFCWQVTAVRADVEPLVVETVKAGRVPVGVE